MVMSLSLSPEAGGQTTPAVLHSTLQDLCSMSVSKLPVWVTRKRCLFPDVFSVNHPGLTEETEPNTVGCFCIWTSLCWQWVPEFSVKTQTFTFDILEGKHTYLISSFEVLLHLWKKLHKAYSLRMSCTKFDSESNWFASSVKLHSGFCSLDKTICGSAALIFILFFHQESDIVIGVWC